MAEEKFLLLRKRPAVQFCSKQVTREGILNIQKSLAKVCRQARAVHECPVRFGAWEALHIDFIGEPSLGLALLGVGDA